MSANDKYLTTMKNFSDTHLFAEDGTRIFNTEGGVAEAERIAKLMRELIPTHNRSPKFRNAMETWAQFIERETKAASENLDWAVLQGSIYAGYSLD